jgi:hypothetical protein
MRRRSQVLKSATAIMLSAFWATNAIPGGVPSIKCFGMQSVRGDAMNAESISTDATTDVFRFTAGGDLFHSWRGRAEYRYNSVRVLEPGRYASGHMVFLLADDQSVGYVAITNSVDWRVIYLRCVK